MEKIESVCCYECGGTDVSDSPNSPFSAYCWDCQNYVATLVRTVKE